MELPAVASVWIHCETLTLYGIVKVHARMCETDIDVVDVQVVGAPGRSLIPVSELIAGFIPDGPVTLEALVNIGWEKRESGAYFNLDSSNFLWWEMRTGELHAEHDSYENGAIIKMLKPETIRDALLAMRTFGIATLTPTPA